MFHRRLVLGALLLAGVSGCEKAGSTTAVGPPDGATEAFVTVRTELARRGAMSETVEALGRCEALPDQIATLTPAVEGHVHELFIKHGDSVKKGQPIVALDETVARADLREKTAIRDGLKASLAVLKSLPRLEECASSELAVEQATVAIERAQAVAEGLQSLRGDNLTSKQQLFDAEKALEAARLQQKAAVATSRDDDRSAPGGGRRSRGQNQDGRRADCIFPRAFRLSHDPAPIDGTLDSLTCRIGQTIAIGSPIGEVVDTRRVFASIWLPTRSASSVGVGQAARVWPADARDSSAEASDDKEKGMPGKVAFVGRVADPQTGNLPIRILVENQQGRLTLGQSLRASITVDERKETLQVPAVAILDLGEGPVLNVVRDGKSVVLHPEVVRHGDWVSVSGTDLKEGESVIVEGGYNLPEGTPVKGQGVKTVAQAEAEAGP